MNCLCPAFVYVSKGVGRVLDEYIEKYGRRLYGLCRTLCKNLGDADDLYQKTWLKVYQKLAQYNPEYTLGYDVKEFGTDPSKLEEYLKSLYDKHMMIKEKF